MTLTTPIRDYCVFLRLALDIFYLHTKFGDSCFSRSGGMIADVKNANGSRDPDHDPFKGDLYTICSDLI